MSAELTEALFTQAAGWDAVKRARAYLAQGHVLSSYWAPPLLRGVVQSEGASFRASMVINNNVDIENLCNCRDAREWGKICAHGVAVALHWLNAQKPASAAPGKPAPGAPGTVRAAATPAQPAVAAKKSSLLRAADGEPAELFFILPPNFDQAVTRGKIMLVFEARWGGGRSPLNAVP